LRILILGGTGFIGPHFVRAALSKGHHVAVFNRGNNCDGLPPHIELLRGDRDSDDLAAIEGRDWDAVLEMAAYRPNWVRSLGREVARRTQHYTFVSTCMVYDEPILNSGGTREDAPLKRYRSLVDPYSREAPFSYGEMKVLCEREAELCFPGRTLILRPGNIVGPGEVIGSLTYWLARAQHGGRMLVGGDPNVKVQMIDVRDLAEWTIELIGRRVTGPFNAIGPASTMTLREMIGAALRTSEDEPIIQWVPVPWAKEAIRHLGVEKESLWWSSLLFWPTECETPGLLNMNNRRSIQHGLTFRGIDATALDTLAWYRSLSLEGRNQATLGIDPRARAIEDSLACESNLLARLDSASRDYEGWPESSE
jgi:2'-hydroxyisoflavone reductase